MGRLITNPEKFAAAAIDGFVKAQTFPPPDVGSKVVSKYPCQS
jgi:hypothetical protein